jgi:hypothetical protein
VVSTSCAPPQRENTLSRGNSLGVRRTVTKRRLASALLLVLLGIGAASCAGEDQRGSPSHQVSEWVDHTGFGQDIGALVADNARITKETTVGAMHAACGTMELDADTANQELPIHGAAQVSEWLATAYGLEGTAANQCYNAGVTNEPLLAKAEQNLKKAQVLLTRSLIAIQSIDGRLPTTTTTTDNTPGNILG